MNGIVDNHLDQKESPRSRTLKLPLPLFGIGCKYLLEVQFTQNGLIFGTEVEYDSKLPDPTPEKLVLGEKDTDKPPLNINEDDIIRFVTEGKSRETANSVLSLAKYKQLGRCGDPNCCLKVIKFQCTSTRCFMWWCDKCPECQYFGNLDDLKDHLSSHPTRSKEEERTLKVSAINRRNYEQNQDERKEKRRRRYHQNK